MPNIDNSLSSSIAAQQSLCSLMGVGFQTLNLKFQIPNLLTGFPQLGREL
jgi:hypothetical protein